MLKERQAAREQERRDKSNKSIGSEEDEKEREKQRREIEIERMKIRESREKERERDRWQKQQDEKEFRDREREWEGREREKERERERKERDEQREYYDRNREEDKINKERRQKEKERRKKEKEREEKEDSEDREREIKETEEKRVLEEIKVNELKPKVTRVIPQSPEEVKPKFNEIPFDNSPLSSPQSLEAVKKSITGSIGSIGINKSNTKKRPDLLSAAPGFTVEEEVEEWVPRKKRELIRLDGTVAEPKSSANAQDLQILAEKVPTDKDKVFAYPLNWAGIDEAKIIEKRVVPWVSKKIAEYIGEEEKSLIDFIISKLNARAPPDDITRNLKVVLEEEAEQFVYKLWRLLIMLSLLLNPQ